MCVGTPGPLFGPLTVYISNNNMVPLTPVGSLAPRITQDSPSSSEPGRTDDESWPLSIRSTEGGAVAFFQRDQARQAGGGAEAG